MIRAGSSADNHRIHRTQPVMRNVTIPFYIYKELNPFQATDIDTISKWGLCSQELFGDWQRQQAAGGLTDIQRAARCYY